MSPLEILVTNDDGVEAAGLGEMARAMALLGRVTVVAPDRERSGTSHSLTLRRPLRVRWLGERVASVDGTPTDCVLLAVHDLLGRPPDVVVSGVNHGPNLGNDVIYSGTVAAAYEGTILGIPSLAVSLVPAPGRAAAQPRHLAVAADVTRALVEGVRRFGLPAGTLLNVNVLDLPAAEQGTIAWTRLGKRVYFNAVQRREDADGEPVFTIGGEPSWRPEAGTDFAALDRGEISVTPVRWNLTDDAALAHLATWRLEGLR